MKEERKNLSLQTRRMTMSEIEKIINEAFIGYDIDNPPSIEELNIIASMTTMFRAKDAEVESGVIIATINRQYTDFCVEFLENVKGVDTYTFETSDVIDSGSVLVTIYLEQDLVSVTDQSLFYDEAEQDRIREVITEVLHKYKVNSRGIKTKKAVCAKGYRFDREENICKKMDSVEMMHLRKGAKRALLTKRGLGTGYLNRIKIKAKRADKFRKAFGIKAGAF